MGEINSFPINTSTISERTVNTQLQDSDLFLTRQAGVDKQYSGARLKEELAKSATKGGFCVDSGVANAYVLEPSSGYSRVPALEDGMRFFCETSNANTGATTVNAHNTGAKAVVTKNGNALTGGEIYERFEVQYDASEDEFVLLDKFVNNYNPIRNPRFRINQRGVTGTVTLAAHEYGHDGWGGGDSGCTYTFVVSQWYSIITITSGSLKQKIESTRLENGNYTLYHQGTAQGRINAGAYGDSGTVTETLGTGADATVEFGVGTVFTPKLEKDGFTRFEFKTYQEDLQENLQHLWIPTSTLTLLVGCRLLDATSSVVNIGSFVLDWNIPWMRATPTVVLNGNATVHSGSGATLGTLSSAPVIAENGRSRADFTFSTNVSVGNVTQLRFSGRPHITAELAL